MTARGWEDLSETLCSYERLGFPIEEGLFGEFLQHPQIAASFGAFFRLFSACREQLDVTAVLSGASAEAAPALRALRFDGRLAAVEFLLHTLTRELAQWRADAALTQSLESFLAALQAEAEPLATARGNLARRERAVQIRKECGALSAGGRGGGAALFRLRPRAARWRAGAVRADGGKECPRSGAGKARTDDRGASGKRDALRARDLRGRAGTAGVSHAAGRIAGGAALFCSAARLTRSCAERSCRSR